MKKITKCDVVIPVYNAPEYVKLCVYALLKNTDEKVLGKVYLINDNSNDLTTNLLNNLEKKYKNKLEIITNHENQGFIKNVNKGFQISKSDAVLLLNTDCLIGKNTIEKLMEHINKNPKIGLICPVSSNAANLTLPIFPGFSYMMMDQLLEKKFKGKNFDACTVVGNCLMITKECIEKTGYFDEIYGMGYCDETDYQFKAMKQGFEAKVAIDTYVFHKAEMSFKTTNIQREERLKHNLDIFWSRWKQDYDELMEKYQKNDPIKYINEHLTREDKQINHDATFVLPLASNTSGGVRVIVDIINYLSINNRNIGMLSLHPSTYNEIELFNPLYPEDIKNLKTKLVIGTIFESMFFTKKLAEKINAKTVYFSQGYEFVFENGKRYEEVELSFKMADYILTVSNYLTNTYQDLFGIKSTPIVNGIDTDLLLTEKKNQSVKNIMMVLRNEPRKADYMLLDILKHLTVKCNNININVVINSKEIKLPINNNKTINVNTYYGPLTRPQIFEILKNSDLLIDTSLSEGFGLMPLEAMAFGVVPVISNSFGLNGIVKNEENGIVINEVNNPYLYVEKIKELMADEKKYSKLSKNAYNTAKKYDFDDVAKEYWQVFEEILEGKIKPLNQTLTEEEKEKIKNYIIDDRKYYGTFRMSENVRRLAQNKPIRRISRIKWLVKHTGKEILFISKEFVKIILNR